MLSRYRLGAMTLVLAMVSATARTQGPESTPASLALTGLAIIDVETGAITRDQTILIDGGVIRSVTSAADATRGIDKSTLVVDLPGRYAIPGLWDMHVHFRTLPTADEPFEVLVDENRALLPQYIGFGVTGVRDMGGDIPEHVLAWDKEAAAGTLIGPRIFSSLRKLDGPPPVEGTRPHTARGSVPVASIEEVEAAIDSHLAAGAALIKFHTLWIDADVFLAGLRAAERRGLPTAAHVPAAVTLEDAIEAGLDSIEHSPFLLGAFPPESRRALAAGEGQPSAADVEHAREVFRDTRAHNVAITPTQHAVGRLSSITDVSAHDDDPRLQQVPPGIRRSYSGLASAMAARDPESVQRTLRSTAVAADLVRVAATEGVMVLAGSDSGPGNAFVYPGDSLHAELELLVAAGLSPLQVLQAATINGATWLGVDDRFGTIASGRAADIVILEADPLADIRNTRATVGVVLSGAYLDADALDELRTLVQPN